jgi:hypothetical protein
LSKVTMEQLAEAASVDVSVLKQGVRAIEEGVYGERFRHRPNRKVKRPDDPETSRLAADLLRLGLKETTVCQVLKDLNPELCPWHGRAVFWLVRRASRQPPWQGS